MKLGFDARTVLNMPETEAMAIVMLYEETVRPKKEKTYMVKKKKSHE